jgi:2-polyprenyl-3-methyl-5-hydroxy-6-metoxy-1,4-benzoquinol methylase
MNPAFSDEVISSFYDEDYYTGKNEYSYTDEREIRKAAKFVFDKRIKNIRKYVKSGNFLDIGTSFGGLMQSASAFFKVYGIEISKYSGKIAADYSAGTVHIGTIENHPFEENFFSVITMIELIEHLKNPKEVIEACYKLLQPTGLLVVQTANMEGLQAKKLKSAYNYFLPGHLSYFSKRNLIKLLKEVGFDYIKVYHPVEFGLLPKIRKSMASFKKFTDYFYIIKIIWYHAKSKLAIGNFCLTSSMVLYAVKSK